VGDGVTVGVAVGDDVGEGDGTAVALGAPVETEGPGDVFMVELGLTVAVSVGVPDGNTILLVSSDGKFVGVAVGPEVFVVSDLPIKTPMASTMTSNRATATMFRSILLF